jgi:hypothetical protein
MKEGGMKMEIFKDEITGYEYVDFEDVLDEGIEIDETTKLLINEMINDYLHNLIRKFIWFNSAVSSLRSPTSFNHDEIVLFKYTVSELYLDIGIDYDDAKIKYGYWKYIDNYTIEQAYQEAGPCEGLQLSDIFEDKDFLKNIMKLKEKVEI